MGSTIEGSSFSGLLTRVDIGHIRIGPDGNGRIAHPAGVVVGREDERHARAKISHPASGETFVTVLIDGKER